MTVSEAPHASLGLLDALPLPAVIVDPLGHVLAANTAARTLLLTPRGQLQGRPFAGFFDTPSRRTLMHLLLAGGTHVRTAVGLRGPDGTLKPADLLVAPDGPNRLCVLLDRTAETAERERAREVTAALDRARAVAVEGADADVADIRRVRLGRLLEEIEQGIVAVDAESVVRFANQAALDVLDGIEWEVVLPARWHGFEVRGFVQSLFDPTAVSAEATVQAGDRLVRLSGIPAADDLALVLVTDITARAQQEEAERDFVANAAHELLNPVAAIMSAADAVELADRDPREQRRFLEHIIRECRRLDRLLRALLDLARVQHRGQPPALEPVALRELLVGVADGLRPGPDVEVSVLCPSALVVATNAELLEHAVANLAANAVRYTDAGMVRITALAARSRVVIDVDDTGPGIPADIRRLVVERFYRAKQDGSGAGLGLAIARQAVEAVAGHLELLDSPLGGTRARIVLPELGAA